ncbi:tRNA-specific adenosine-34 deaminase subunit [Scheffersomyces coipomensis]|uniref:tRNA-specific adenosine-34 deaminase subunit n=1 Tax=Scheffersomyces coipomensis TaxID=1788519 RepID=UPI00315C664F
MARKNRTIGSDHVDIENGILYGVIKQIRAKDSESFRSNTASLVNVWCCQIQPSQTQLLAAAIRDHINSKDEVSLVHLKRFLKEEDESGNVFLKAIICSTEYLTTRSEVENFLTLHLHTTISDIYIIEVPKFPASTKEISDDWSEKYWPMSWKGNPNHQFLNSVNFNMKFEREIVSQLIEEYRQSKDFPTSVTIIVKETKNQEGEILAVVRGGNCNNPFEHSIMKGIDFVSKSEQQRRKHSIHETSDPSNYLCHNLWFYVSHEPCVMCSMALVHSRIGRVTFLESSPSSGGLESYYQLGDRDGLNWKFQIWKWIDENDINVINKIYKSPTPINY